MMLDNRPAVLWATTTQGTGSGVRCSSCILSVTIAGAHPFGTTSRSLMVSVCAQFSSLVILCVQGVPCVI
jgi:hypothetical protein